MAERRQLLSVILLHLFFFALPCKWCVVGREDLVDEVSMDRLLSYSIVQ